ncbi:MAG: hypothetical protein AB7U41_05110 [Dongiaceae bacterium]
MKYTNSLPKPVANDAGQDRQAEFDCTFHELNQIAPQAVMTALKRHEPEIARSASPILAQQIFCQIINLLPSALLRQAPQALLIGLVERAVNFTHELDEKGELVKAGAELQKAVMKLNQFMPLPPAITKFWDKAARQLDETLRRRHKNPATAPLSFLGLAKDFKNHKGLARQRSLEQFGRELSQALGLTVSPEWRFYDLPEGVHAACRQGEIHYNEARLERENLSQAIHNAAHECVHWAEALLARKPKASLLLSSLSQAGQKEFLHAVRHNKAGYAGAKQFGYKIYASQWAEQSAEYGARKLTAVVLAALEKIEMPAVEKPKLDSRLARYAAIAARLNAAGRRAA